MRVVEEGVGGIVRRGEEAEGREVFVEHFGGVGVVIEGG